MRFLRLPKSKLCLSEAHYPKLKSYEIFPRAASKPNSAGSRFPSSKMSENSTSNRREKGYYYDDQKSELSYGEGKLKHDSSLLEKELINLLFTESNKKSEISDEHKFELTSGEEETLKHAISSIEKELIGLLYAESSYEKKEVGDKAKALIKQHKMLLRKFLHYQGVKVQPVDRENQDFSRSSEFSKFMYRVFISGAISYILFDLFLKMFM